MELLRVRVTVILCVASVLMNKCTFAFLPYEFSCHPGGGRGKREMKGDAFCEHKRSSNCPYIPRRYWCGEEYTSKIMAKIKTEHPKTNIFSDTYKHEWMEMLDKSGSILFVGDSVHSHAAFSLMCALRADLNGKKLAFTKLFPHMKKVGQYFARVSRKYFCVQTVTERAICYDRTNTAAVILENYEDYKRLFAKFGTVVMNFGLHNKELRMDPIQELFKKLSGDISQSKTTLIWRETAPQHFNNPGGVYSPDVLAEKCIDTSHDSIEISNQFNLKYNPICQKYEIPVLKIWNMTRSFFSAHVQGECTHYCQPGVADLWVERLLVRMKALYHST